MNKGPKGGIQAQSMHMNYLHLQYTHGLITFILLNPRIRLMLYKFNLKNVWGVIAQHKMKSDFALFRLIRRKLPPNPSYWQLSQ